MSRNSLLSVDEALERVVAAARPLGSEQIPLALSRGRVLAEPVSTSHPLPLFTQSAVDGYALRIDDLGALPCQLPLSAPIAARGHDEHPRLPAGEAMRILTGGLLPLGADTVVRQELTRREGDAVSILEPVQKGSDIRKAGEEMPMGARLADAGQWVTPGLVGTLAIGGARSLSVFRQPRIIVLVSGDEVVSDGRALQLGQVPDANGPLVSAFLSAWGLTPLRVEAMADTPEAVESTMSRALVDADLVITTGGVSVGDHDYIPQAAKNLGLRELVWKVAQKPGMPLYVGQGSDRLLFGLPGNPASVLVNLIVYVRAALDAMQGLPPQARWNPSPNLGGLDRDAKKTLWQRVRVTHQADGCLDLARLGGQSSHMLGNLAAANALLRIGPKNALEEVLSWTYF